MTSVTEERPPVHVESVVDLLSKTELTEIRTYLLQGERAEHGEPEGSGMAISARGDSDWVEVRCRMTVQTEEADLVVDRSAMFRHAEPLEVGSDTVREFIEKVGVMTVYPYLREGVFTLASNLGISAPVMALMRAGSIRVDELSPEQSPGGPPAQVKRTRSKKRTSEG